MRIDPEQLGSAIREIRELRGLTQRELASRLDVTVNYLSLLENGKRGISHPTLNKAAEILKVSPAIITFLGTVCDNHKDDLLAKLSRQIQLLIRTTVAAERSRPKT